MICRGGQLRTSKCPQTLSVCHFPLHWPLIIQTVNTSEVSQYFLWDNTPSNPPLQTLSAAEKKHFSEEKNIFKETSWCQSLRVLLINNSGNILKLSDPEICAWLILIQFSFNWSEMFCGAFHWKSGIASSLSANADSSSANADVDQMIMKVMTGNNHQHHHPHPDDDYENGRVCDCSG